MGLRVQAPITDKTIFFIRSFFLPFLVLSLFILPHLINFMLGIFPSGI